MKITKNYLKQIIKEELEASNENVNISPDYGGTATQDYLNKPTIQKFRQISNPVEKIKYLKELIDDALGDKQKKPVAVEMAADFLLDTLNLK